MEMAATALGEQGVGALGLAIGRVEVEGRLALPSIHRAVRSLTAVHNRPVSRPAAAGIKHRNRRIVGMQGSASAHMRRAMHSVSGSRSAAIWPTQPAMTERSISTSLRA